MTISPVLKFGAKKNGLLLRNRPFTSIFYCRCDSFTAASYFLLHGKLERIAFDRDRCFIVAGTIAEVYGAVCFAVRRNDYNALGKPGTAEIAYYRSSDGGGPGFAVAVGSVIGS